MLRYAKMILNMKMMLITITKNYKHKRGDLL